VESGRQDSVDLYILFYFTGASQRTAESPRRLRSLLHLLLFVTQLNHTHREARAQRTRSG